MTTSLKGKGPRKLIMIWSMSWLNGLPLAAALPAALVVTCELLVSGLVLSSGEMLEAFKTDDVQFSPALDAAD